MPRNRLFYFSLVLSLPAVNSSAIQSVKTLKDRTIFVHGASGGVGSSLVKILLSLRETDPQYRNIHVVASCSTERAQNYLSSLGVDLVVNRRDSKYLEKVHSVNGGKGPDVIFEMLANANLNRDMVGGGKSGDR